jgi:predicted amidophosphoribosyltransferase
VRVDHPYHGGIAHLVGLAKAVGRPAAVRALGDLLPDPPDDAPSGGVVVPVPASPGRRPGPHLGSALARAGARRWHLPLRHLLITTRLGAEQHRLSPAERRANVVGLFRCVKPAPAYVILVDDLITTGATASAAAAALREAGAKRVDLVCLARTPKPGEYRDIKQPNNVAKQKGGSGEAALSGGRQTP